MKGEDSIYFDIPVPDSFIERTVGHKMHDAFVKDDPLRNYFKGENTRDFYCGMIAGIRAAESILQSMSFEQAKDAITATSMIATHFASKATK